MEKDAEKAAEYERHLVSKESVDDVLRLFTPGGLYALDTETTGLNAYGGDRLFSMILAREGQAFYFNFHSKPDIPTPHVLNFDRVMEQFQEVLAASTWFMHNAKFDMAMLEQEGISWNGVHVHCTAATARIVNNRELSLSLGALTGAKSDAVKTWCLANNAYTVFQPHGKKKKEKKLHFDRVPFEIMAEYACQDAWATLRLGRKQLDELRKINDRMPESRQKDTNANIYTVYHRESALTSIMYNMEKRGVRIDAGYCDSAFAYERMAHDNAVAEFESLAGREFVDSGKSLAAAFSAAGEKFPTTEKGNPSFTDRVLQDIDSPMASAVRRIRRHYKRAGTYFRNFIDLADKQDRLHANIRQGGTETGRVSYSEPNLQNVPKQETDTKFPVRGAVIPDPGCTLVMIDYDQMEYRLMLDYAAEMPVIERINSGMDVHHATADLMGVERHQAKTINFMLLYGGGEKKLALELGCSLAEAKRLRAQYFAKLPRVARFIDRVIAAARSRRYIVNWSGRVCRFHDLDFTYKAPNHLIQGGCADVIKSAMVTIAQTLPWCGMAIQVHDELVFNWPNDFIARIPEAVEIMENAYPHQHLKLTCGVEHSTMSWFDKKEGLP